MPKPVRVCVPAVSHSPKPLLTSNPRTDSYENGPDIDVWLDRSNLGNSGDHKQVGQGVYELRLFVGPGYRAYYGIAGKHVVLLLTGGSKKGIRIRSGL